MTNTTGPEIICLGEALMDLISVEYAADFRSADTYRRLPGGSPMNLAMNLARLNRRVAFVGSVGQDDAGSLLVEALREAGVDTSHVRRDALPTTLILVTKSRTVSDFEPYRLADTQITAGQIEQLSYDSVKVLHTTAFALSQEPARTAILQALTKGAAAGAVLSVDFNYADKIWAGDRAAGRKILTRIAEAGGMVKISDVDFERLFGEAVDRPEVAARAILELGASVVCLTLGSEGCYVCSPIEEFALPANAIEVVDTTGAGDAFWSGFLAAYVQNYDLRKCALAGRGMAERKLTRLGPVTDSLTVRELL